MKANPKNTLQKRSYFDPVLLFAIVLVVALLFLFILLPLLSILKGSFVGNENQLTLTAYKNLFKNNNFITAFGNTLKLGLVVGFTSTVIGFLFAYVNQCVKSPFKKLFSLIEILPTISPPFVLALSAITLLGRRGLITYKLLGIKNFDIYGFPGLVVVQTIDLLPNSGFDFGRIAGKL